MSESLTDKQDRGVMALLLLSTLGVMPGTVFLTLLVLKIFDKTSLGWIGVASPLLIVAASVFAFIATAFIQGVMKAYETVKDSKG